MLQQTAVGVNQSGVTCACGKMKYCDYSCMRDARTHNAVAVGHGLGINPARMEGRRVSRVMAVVFENAVKYFGLSADEIAQAQDAQAEKAQRREESSRLAHAEIEAGKAAFLAGIDYADPVLSKIARQGWQHAQRRYNDGRRLVGSGLVENGTVSLADAALRAGYEDALTAQRLESMVAL